MNLFVYFRERVVEALDRMVEAGDLPAGTDMGRVVEIGRASCRERV